MQMHRYLGRLYKVMAEFPESDTAAANEFMLKNDGASVLEVANDVVIIAHVDDLGVCAPQGDSQ